MSRRGKIVVAVVAALVAGFFGVSCWEIHNTCSTGPMGCVARPLAGGLR
jgi:hypothetical protein